MIKKKLFKSWLVSIALDGPYMFVQFPSLSLFSFSVIMAQLTQTISNPSVQDTVSIWTHNQEGYIVCEDYMHHS